MVKHCCVVGCTTDNRKDPAARFFYFPNKTKKPSDWQHWIRNVNRLEKDRVTVWLARKDSVVCYKHFVMGEPTTEHPVPTLQMGHDNVSQSSVRRTITKHPIKRKQYQKRKRKENNENVPLNTATQSTVEIAANIIASIKPLSLTQGSHTDSNQLTPASSPNSALGFRGTIQLDFSSDDQPYATTTMHDASAEVQIPQAHMEQPSEGFCHDVHQHIEVLNSFHSYSKNKRPFSEVDQYREAAVELQRENKRLKAELHAAEEEARKKPQRMTHKTLVGDDKKTRQFTGFPTYKCFNTIFERYIEPKAMLLAVHHEEKNGHWRTKKAYHKKPGPPRIRCLKDEFFMTMMRLRLGSLQPELAEWFGVSTQQVSCILSYWIPFLAKCLGKLIRFPSKEKVKKHMPKSFQKKHSKTRVIIDCTEIFIERTTSLLPRQQTWSNYKHHNTAKFLVGITPGGGICFLSKAWGGRASDKHIVKESGFLDMLEPYDEVMADRGFIISAELAERLCTLNMPPFTKGKTQLSYKEVQGHRTISSLRIHVERAIERIKNFRILQGVFPLKQIHMLNDIMTVCSAVINLWPPIVTA